MGGFFRFHFVLVNKCVFIAFEAKQFRLEGGTGRLKKQPRSPSSRKLSEESFLTTKQPRLGRLRQGHRARRGDLVLHALRPRGRLAAGARAGRAARDVLRPH